MFSSERKLFGKNILFEGKREPVGATIDMAPLVDVVFLLLIFLMLGARFSRPVMDLQLPVAGAGTTAGSHHIVLSVDRNGLYQVGTRQVEPAELPVALRAALAKSPDLGLVIRADANARVQSFVFLLDCARRSGAHSVSIEHARGGPSFAH